MGRGGRGARMDPSPSLHRVVVAVVVSAVVVGVPPSRAIAGVLQVASLSLIVTLPLPLPLRAEMANLRPPGIEPGTI